MKQNSSSGSHALLSLQTNVPNADERDFIVFRGFYCLSLSWMWVDSMIKRDEIFPSVYLVC